MIIYSIIFKWVKNCLSWMSKLFPVLLGEMVSVQTSKAVKWGQRVFCIFRDGTLGMQKNHKSVDQTYPQKHNEELESAFVGSSTPQAIGHCAWHFFTALLRLQKLQEFVPPIAQMLVLHEWWRISIHLSCALSLPCLMVIYNTSSTQAKTPEDPNPVWEAQKIEDCWVLVEEQKRGLGRAPNSL